MPHAEDAKGAKTFYSHCRPMQIGGYRISRLKQHDKRLRRWIAQPADLTLVELQQRCQKELAVPIGLTALWHRLDRLGLSYKKTAHAAEQARPDVKAARRRWRKAQPQWASARLVLIDETSSTRKWRGVMAARCGASAAWRLGRAAVGKPRPSSLRNATTAWRHLASLQA